MESEKARPPRTKKHLGLRILLGIAANLGVLSLGRGLGEMLHLWSGPQQLLWHYVWFSVPYILLLLVFIVALVMAIQAYTRTSAVLVVLGVVLSASLFLYDIKHQRAQYIVATVTEDGSIDYHPYYVFWWWWEEWGEICVQ